MQQMQPNPENQYVQITEMNKTSQDNTLTNQEKLLKPFYKLKHHTQMNNQLADKITPQAIHPLINPSIDPTISQTNFTAKQLIKLYNIPTVTKSTPNTRQVVIAIIIAYHCPTIQNDLNTYWQSTLNFGPSSIAPTVNVYTFPDTPVNTSWNIEECLDVQIVATANPNAKIWVVEAKSESNVDLNNAIIYATNIINADIISCSWGCDDTQMLISDNNVFINPKSSSNYKCFCVSSGDNNSVCWPSVLSNVISVGGSSLIWDPTPSNNTSRIEFTWPDAGCGYSTSVSKPSYQNNVNTNLYRATPDISLIANPLTGVTIYSNGEWYSVGGTSLSCPLFAGILSLATQMRFNLRKTPLTSIYTETPTVNNIPAKIPPTNIQNFLYNTIYNSPSLKSSCLTDINIGSDGIYLAKTGYDIATGLGSPNATNLCKALALNMP